MSLIPVSTRQTSKLWRVMGVVLAVLLVGEMAPAGAVHAAEKKTSRKKLPVPTGPAASESPADTSKSPVAIEARRRGMVGLNIGHYEEAINAFEEAYALDQDPKLLFHLAQAYRLAGQPRKALDACSAFLRSSSGSDSDRALAERFLAEVEMIVYQIRLQRDSAMPPAKAPPAALEPPPMASAQKQEERRPVPALDLRPRSTATDNSLLLTTRVPSEQAQKPLYKRPTFWVVAGTAVVAGAVTLWLVERSRGLKSPNTQLGYQQAFP